ncbi:MAG: hypothetical protein JXR48_09430 [Candidatus Delongbacteria bacterium]|nr:hypothetical protein [Candidatus Delongbacteria bacterium]
MKEKMLKDNISFVAIDFETASPKWTSICSVGIVTVENGKLEENTIRMNLPPKGIKQSETEKKIMGHE